MVKTFITTAALSIALLAGLSASNAEARVNIDVGIGLVDGGYGYQEVYDQGYDRGYDERRHDERRYDDRRYDDRRYGDRRYDDRRYDEGVTCKYGRKMVSRQGFHSIEILDCEGRGYTYRARRDGHRYIVRTNRRGEVVRVERD